MEIRPALQRKEIRRQVLEESLSKETNESESESSILGINRPLNEIQSMILAGKRLGVEFSENHVRAMAKLIEKKDKEYNLLLRNIRGLGSSLKKRFMSN